VNWPNDADGDVFRRLVEHNFDFSVEHVVDYNVDFDPWPPPTEALNVLAAAFGPVSAFPPDNDFGGYVLFQVRGRLTYEKVCDIQKRASNLVREYGGVCESWGVLQEPQIKH